MSENVYLLWFVQECDDGEEIELLIGVYATEEDARAVIDRLKDKRGFVDYPAGFQIHSRQLGQDDWTEGFIRDT